MRVALITCCAISLAVPSADARQKNPDTEEGNVTCECQCQANTSEGLTQETKLIGGEGNWKGSRAQCREFSNSRCTIEEGDSAWVGKLGACDTIVHKLPPGQPPALEMAPTTGKTTPPPSSSGAGTKAPSKTLNLPFKLQRKAD